MRKVKFRPYLPRERVNLALNASYPSICGHLLDKLFSYLILYAYACSQIRFAFYDVLYAIWGGKAI